MQQWEAHIADAGNLPLGDDAVDLVFCSPPYEARRRYAELDFRLKSDDWVNWAIPRFMEHLRVCNGLVAWVVDGSTEKYRYSAVVEKLMVRLADQGACLRRPCYYMRHGIPGSGGPDWFKSCIETVICGTRVQGRLPWSDNTACGNAPKFEPGGDTSHWKTGDRRVRVVATLGAGARSDGGVPSHGGRSGELREDGTITRKNGKTYVPPELANPGNVIRCSGGHLGHSLAHENEAPFPLQLAEFFVKSFCPPDGLVCDPFCGSGTTLHAAVLNGRRAIGYDLRLSQIDLTTRRMLDVFPAEVSA